jgi:hypothetical protein
VADRLKVPLKELTKHFVANHLRPRGRFITDGNVYLDKLAWW